MFPPPRSPWLSGRPTFHALGWVWLCHPSAGRTQGTGLHLDFDQVPHRAPDGYALIRVFIGRAGQEDQIPWDDDSLLDIARARTWTDIGDYGRTVADSDLSLGKGHAAVQPGPP